MKFFQCETRLRDLLQSLIEPAVAKSKLAAETSQNSALEVKAMGERLDKMDQTVMKHSAMFKRIDELHKNLIHVEGSMNAQNSVQKDSLNRTNDRIDQL